MQLPPTPQNSVQSQEYETDDYAVISTSTMKIVSVFIISLYSLPLEQLYVNVLLKLRPCTASHPTLNRGLLYSPLAKTAQHPPTC